jgi:hypothetical protein
MQEIIVLIIIAISIGYTVYSFIKVFGKKTQNSCGCSSSSCSVKPNIQQFKSATHKNHF